jgi:hypothetical protein
MSALVLIYEGVELTADSHHVFSRIHVKSVLLGMGWWFGDLFDELEMEVKDGALGISRPLFDAWGGGLIAGYWGSGVNTSPSGEALD